MTGFVQIIEHDCNLLEQMLSFVLHNRNSNAQEVHSGIQNIIVTAIEGQLRHENWCPQT